jgi:hypothetical protein
MTPLTLLTTSPSRSPYAVEYHNALGDEFLLEQIHLNVPWEADGCCEIDEAELAIERA